jgi:hypothetical protein
LPLRLQHSRGNFDLDRFVALSRSPRLRRLNESVDQILIGSESAHAAEGPNQVSDCGGQATILRQPARISPAQTLMKV